MKMLLCFVFVVMIAFTSMTNAGIVGTYVDADDTNTCANGSEDPWYETSDTDGLWYYRSYDTVTEDGDIFQGLGAIPTLKTTITDLTPDTLYDISIIFVGKYNDSDCWSTAAGLTAASLTSFYYGDNVSSTTGKELASGAGCLTQLQASLGTAVADSSGNIDIYVNRGVVSDVNGRAWYDGVAYAASVPEPSTLALLLFGAGTLSLIVARRRGC